MFIVLFVVCCFVVIVVIIVALPHQRRTSHPGIPLTFYTISLISFVVGGVNHKNNIYNSHSNKNNNNNNRNNNNNNNKKKNLSLSDKHNPSNGFAAENLCNIPSSLSGSGCCCCCSSPSAGGGTTVYRTRCSATKTISHIGAGIVSG